MTDGLRLAMLQMISGDGHSANAATLAEAAARAAGEGAKMLALPEAAGLMQRDRDRAREIVTTEDADPFVAACREAATAHGLWVQLGSTPIRAEDGRFLNHALLIAPDGGIAARYDKIHLFDVFLDGREPTGESRRYAPGDSGVLVETPWGRMGLTICYDLRFPQLFRAYAKAGARVIFVPSAFTVPTGAAHWEPLLRARAIENGVWIVAAAQVGNHADGRVTWGHSLIVSPWGEVICDLGGDGPAQRTVELDLTRVEAARRQIPSLENERAFTMAVLGRETAAVE